MREFRSRQEVVAAGLPPWQGQAVAEAVAVLEGVFGRGFDPARGVVVLVEEGDSLESVAPSVGRPFAEVTLETTTRRHGCLVGLTLWGNSGDGVTWVCPDREGHAPAVRARLRAELAEP